MGAAGDVQEKMQDLKLEQPKSFADIVSEKKPYYQKRVDLFEKYLARDTAAIDAAKQANVPITVVLPDGATKPAIKGVTTPMDIANAISKGLAKQVVVSKVDGDVWDLFRPLEADCALSLHSFDDIEGKEVSCSTAADSNMLSCVVQVPVPPHVGTTHLMHEPQQQPDQQPACPMQIRFTVHVVPSSWHQA